VTEGGVPIRNSIGARILGLAVFLLALTIVLVAFLLHHVDLLQDDLAELTDVDIPLATTLSHLDEYGLRRRLAFERTLGALNLETADERVLAEARDDLEKYTALLKETFPRARALLESEVQSPASAAEAASIDVLLHQVEAAYPPIIEQQQRVLDLQHRGDHAQAYMLADGLNELQRLVQSQRAELQDVTAERAERIAAEALTRQHQIVRLTIAATVSTVALGLLVALMVTKALLRPIHALIGALGDVQKGRLDLELPVPNKDELGALTTSFNYFVRELRDKRQMRETFGKYVDPRILTHVLGEGVVEGAGGGREIMTVSFGDLVGFTAMSERLTPSSMVRLLNRHFGLQAEAVQENQGVVDKFIGDSIMAFWGPPFVTDADHAALACRAALAQVAAIETLRRELAELTGLRRDAPEIDLRLGITTGEVVVGNIGSENTRSFTVIGDNVNLASRLESANRHYGTRILVSSAVARNAGPMFEMREIDTIAVKGKVETEHVFELLGMAGCLDDSAVRARNSFAGGIEAYRRQDWLAAASAFTASLALQPGDSVAKLMLERISHFRAVAPGDDWDGVWRFETK
jgi:class 3 adenylate cyclase